MFNVGLIDSLKLRIKKDKIKIIDKRLISEFIKYYPAEDLIDEQVNNAEPLTYIINGITYRFYFKAFITEEKTAQEYLVLQISAKMLKQAYFDGITINNYKSIVDDINALNVVKIDYKTFLDGLVSDIDICINQLIDEKSLRTAFSLILTHPVQSKKPLIHHITKTHHIKGTINLGIDFNKREKATNSTPYCKIYHKGIELQTKSNDFYCTYLQPLRKSFLENLVRYEFTIKAHKHKQYLQKNELLKSQLKTLEDLLTIPQSELTAIAKSGLPHYVEKAIKTKNYEELSPTEIALKFYIENLINLGFDTEKLLGFTYHIDSKVSRSRTKSRVKEIIDRVSNDNKKLKEKLNRNSTAIIFLHNIGLGEDVPF